MVVFDSQVPVGRAKAVYMSGVAVEVTGAGIEAGAAAYTERSLAKGGQGHRLRRGPRAPGPFRLYRDTVAALGVLDPDNQPAVRTAVTLG
jgi:hypothetical protein